MNRAATRPSVSALLVFGVLLGGCTGAPAAPGGATSSAPAPEVSSDAGAIAGNVVDDELKPITDAELVLGGANMSAVRSDAQGAFTINGVPPGTHTLLVARLGFLAASKRVDVVAGETTRVQITLAPLPVLEPRVENFIDNGHITFSAVVPSVAFHSQSTLGPYKVLFYQNATAGAVGVVSTGTWDRSTPLTASRMGLTLSLGDESNYSAGKAPVTSRIFDLEIEKLQRFSIRFDVVHVCTDGVSCAEDPPNRVAQVVYDQETTVYTSVFYVDPPAADFVAAPT